MPSEAGIETWRQRVDKVLLEQGPQCLGAAGAALFPQSISEKDPSNWGAPHFL